MGSYKMTYDEAQIVISEVSALVEKKVITRSHRPAFTTLGTLYRLTEIFVL